MPVSNHWLLKNGLVSRAIDFDARNGIVTESWKNLTEGKEFINSSRETMDGYCREFRFVANDRAYTGTPQDFALASAKKSTDSGGARHLDLDLTSSDQAVAVTVHYNLPADATGIRQFLDIRNRTARPLTLSQLSIACEMR